MSMLAYIRGVFLKDLRVFRVHLLVLLALGIWVENPVFPHSEDFPGSIAAFVLMEYVLLVLVIQLDPVGREFRFLQTRPVPGPAIGLAKALFAGLFLLLPILLTQEWHLAAAQVPMPLSDHFILALETFSVLSAGFCAVALIAGLCRTPRAVLISLAIIIGVPILGIEFWRSFMGPLPTIPHSQRVDHGQLDSLRDLLWRTVLAVSCLIAIGVRYRTKGFRWPLGIAVVGIALSLLASFCQWNFARSLQEQGKMQALLSPEALARIHMTVLPSGNGTPTYKVNPVGSYGGVAGESVLQQVRMDGVPMPYFVQTIDYHATITLRSGKKFVSNFYDAVGHSEMGGMGMQQMTTAAGVQTPYFFTTHDYALAEFDLASYPTAAFRNQDLTGASIKGVITFAVFRAYKAGVLPVKAGASVSFRRNRYKVVDYTAKEHSITVSLEHYSVPLPLLGENGGMEAPGAFSILPVCRTYGYALDQSNQVFNVTTTLLGLRREMSSATYNGSPFGTSDPHGMQDLPAGWQSAVDLIVIGTEYCGRVQIPYEMDNVNLGSATPHGH